MLRLTARAAHEIFRHDVRHEELLQLLLYGMMTTCGIPNMKLLGTKDDWVSLRTRAEELGALVMPAFGCPFLLPVLDEVVASE